MSENLGYEWSRVGRRQVLKKASAFTTLGVLGTGASTTVDATGGDQWEFLTGRRVHSSPTVVGGTVYIGSYDGILYTMDAETGNQQWVFETDSPIWSSPTVVDETVFVGSRDSNLYAVDAETGSQQWVFETDRIITSSPTVVDGTVYVGSFDETLYAIDAETGSQQWAFETNRRISASSPTVVDGTVFVGSADSNLYAVDAETGNQQWAFETGADISSSPTVVDGVVFIGSDDSNLYAVDAETGSQQWVFRTEDRVRSSPTVVGGTVYVGSRDNNLYAVDAETGSQQWAFETGADIRWSSPTVVDGVVFIGSDDSNLYAVDAETGSQQWVFETRAEIGSSSPTVVNGTVYVGSYDNSLYAVDAGVDGSSEGSRAMLGTLGHHDDWQHAGQSISIPAYALYTSWIRNNSRLLAIGGGGIGTLVGGGYLLRRRKSGEKSEQVSSEGSSGRSSGVSNTEDHNSNDPPEQSENDAQSVIDELRSEAEIAVEAAGSAKQSGDLDEAVDAYNDALTHYQVALDELEPEATETHKEIEESIVLTREKLKSVKRYQEQRDDLIESLNTAERSFQVGIVAYSQGRQTLARIRFRQARDVFDEAINIVENSDDDLLTPPVEVSVQPERQLMSTTLSGLPQVPETAATELADAGVATLDELESSEGSPWLPDTVETLVSEGTIDREVGIMLTLLSWWDDTNNYEFDSEAAISRRREQANYGQTQSS